MRERLSRLSGRAKVVGGGFMTVLAIAGFLISYDQWRNTPRTPPNLTIEAVAYGGNCQSGTVCDGVTVSRRQVFRVGARVTNIGGSTATRTVIRYALPPGDVLRYVPGSCRFGTGRRDEGAVGDSRRCNDAVVGGGIVFDTLEPDRVIGLSIELFPMRRGDNVATTGVVDSNETQAESDAVATTVR